MEPSAVFFIILQLIFLEGILSIDNAAVLGAMVAHLPNDKPIPWPARFQGLQAWSDRTLGPQRQAALKVGLLGAYIGRALMLLLASVIIDYPIILILGAAYLFYLAVDYFADLYREQRLAANAKHGEEAKIVRGGFWTVVMHVELADLAFSVDNVIAAVALSKELWVVLLGVAIGIVIMRFAAQIFTAMIRWEPALAAGAYLLLLSIGLQLLYKELLHEPWGHLGHGLQFGISAAILVLTVVFARVKPLKSALVLFTPFLWLCLAIQWLISTLISAITLPFRMRRPTV